MAKRVILTKQDMNWPTSFNEECGKLRRIIGSILREIHHIGSTAIPGIHAKPIIDIMPVVSSLEAVDDLQKHFENAGYVYRGEYGIPGIRYIVALAGDQIHDRIHVHAFQSAHPEIARLLAFRDYLRCNPGTAMAYDYLKLELKKKFEGSTAQYQDGKNDFIESIVKIAMGDDYVPRTRYTCPSAGIRPETRWPPDPSQPSFPIRRVVRWVPVTGSLPWARRDSQRPIDGSQGDQSRLVRPGRLSHEIQGRRFELPNGSQEKCPFY